MERITLNACLSEGEISRNEYLVSIVTDTVWERI